MEMTKPSTHKEELQQRNRLGTVSRKTDLEFKPVLPTRNLILNSETNFFCSETTQLRILFVLRFYGPVNPMGSCRARTVYLTTRLLGRLSPLSG